MSCINVNANQVDSELLRNGKLNNKIKKKKIKRNRDTECNDFQNGFTMEDLSNGLKGMKDGKEAEWDEITTKQIKYFGTRTKNWLLKLLNTCLKK